jgi:hypothetical protein
MTLGELIISLRRHGNLKMVGLGNELFSYRGHYERSAVLVSRDPIRASDLADRYESQLGKEVMGYKGGDFIISADELVYVVSDERSTGNFVCDLAVGGDGMAHLVTEPDY